MPVSRIVAMSGVGAPEVLIDSVLEVPEPGAGQVLLKVGAAGFNPIDTKIRAGIAPVVPLHGILGCDVCGVVVSVGEGVSGLAVGQRVFGFVGGVKGRWGALSEFMLADAALLAAAPVGLTDAECAVLPLVSVTASEALARLAIESGSELLVLGASGAVGRMAVQMAVRSGIFVTGTAGTEQRCQEVESLGAHAVLHQDVDALIAAGKMFPFVLDTFGGPSLAKALAAASAGGSVATINARGVHDLGLAHAKALTLNAVFVMLPLLSGMGVKRHQAVTIELARQLELGSWQPLPVEAVTASAESVAAVHCRYEAGQLPHKVAFVW